MVSRGGIMRGPTMPGRRWRHNAPRARLPRLRCSSTPSVRAASCSAWRSSWPAWCLLSRVSRDRGCSSSSWGSPCWAASSSGHGGCAIACTGSSAAPRGGPMSDNEKDRLGEKLHQKEKAEEDRYFAEHDKELIEKLRRAMAAARCPTCGAALVAVERGGKTTDGCPARQRTARELVTG